VACPHCPWLPLPIADVSSEELPQVVRRMEQRIVRETGPADAVTLCTAAFILMGLVYPRELIEGLFQGIPAMKESVTYQAILAEGRNECLAEGRSKGRAEEARRILKQLATEDFGLPNPVLESRIDAIDDLARLEELIRRLRKVSGWEELLGEAANGSA
jgi:predicted transposase YdaD